MPAEILNLDVRTPQWFQFNAGKKDGVLKNTTTTVQALTRPLYDDTNVEFAKRKERHYYALEFDVPAAWEPCLNIGNGPTINPQIYGPSNAQDVAQDSVLRFQGTPYALQALNAANGGNHYSTACGNESVLGGPLTPQFVFNDGRKTLNNDMNKNMKHFKAQNDTAPFIHAIPYRQSVAELIGEPHRNQTVTQLAIRELYPITYPRASHAVKSAYQ